MARAVVTPIDRATRGDLNLFAVARTDVDDLPFMLKGKGPSIALSAAELRWLVLAAGPAMLAEHAPLPTAKDAQP